MDNRLPESVLTQQGSDRRVGHGADQRRTDAVWILSTHPCGRPVSAATREIGSAHSVAFAPRSGVRLLVHLDREVFERQGCLKPR